MKGQEVDNSYYFAFENLSRFFENGIISNKNNSDEISMKQFENSFKGFVKNYKYLLGSPFNKEQYNLPDYLLNYSHDNKKKKSQYFKLFEKTIREHPNPFMDRNLVEFLQLLRINYEITGNKELKKYILKQMQYMLFPVNKLRKPRISQNSKKQADDYFTLRWPKETIYRDQEAYIWTLKSNEKQNNKIKTLLGKYGLEMASNIGEIEYHENYYSVFRREIFPVYHWFMKIYFGSEMPNKFDDMLSFSQILLWTINRLISELVFMFGNYTDKEKKINQEIIRKYGLNNTISLNFHDAPKSWKLINTITKPIISNQSKL